MLESLRHLRVGDDDLVDADHMLAALTAGTLVFADGATQVFTSDGRTTYTDDGRPSRGEWWVVGDGKFASFWPLTTRRPTRCAGWWETAPSRGSASPRPNAGLGSRAASCSWRRTDGSHMAPEAPAPRTGQPRDCGATPTLARRTGWGKRTNWNGNEVGCPLAEGRDRPLATESA